MKKNRHYLLIWFLAILALSACSVLPKKVVPQSKLKAYQFLEQARKEELKANYVDAYSIYSEAEHFAILCNDINAQLVAKQGQARIMFVKQDMAAYKVLLDEMQNLVDNVNPVYQYRIQQLLFWEYFRTGSYEKILQAEYKESSLPFHIRVEILSYKVQAQAYLKRNNPEDNKKLTEDVRKYYKKFKRSKNLQAEMISNAYYALAFSNASVGQYTTAIALLKKAITLDRNYDLYVQLADDYALAGLCEKYRGDVTKAKAYYTMAQQLYEELQMTPETEKIRSRLADLKMENK